MEGADGRIDLASAEDQAAAAAQAAAAEAAHAEQAGADGNGEDVQKRQVCAGPGGWRKIIQTGVAAAGTEVLRLVVQYTSKVMDHLPPTRMIRDILFGQSGATAAEQQTPDIQIVWRCGQQLKPIVLNAHGHLMREWQHCCCRSIDSQWLTMAHPVDQQMHLCTMDLDVLGEPQLAALLAKGLNHIPAQPWDAEAAVQALLEGAAWPAAQHMQRKGWWAGNTADELHQIVEQSVRAWVAHRLQGQVLVAEGELVEDLQQRLMAAQRTFWFCEVDKAPSHICVICPALAVALIRKRLSGAADFAQIPYEGDAVQFVVQQLSTELDGILVGLSGLMQPKDVASPLRLPILRINYKSHKDPPSWRFITVGSGTVLEVLSGVVAGICKLLIDCMGADAAQLARDIARWHGVHANYFTLVDGAQQVAINMPDRIRDDFTADITKCFENIPIDAGDAEGVPAVLEGVVGLVFRMQRQQMGTTDPRIAVPLHADNKATAHWVTRPGRSPNKAYLTQQQTLQLMVVAISGAYVVCGSTMYRQTRGIPMGAAYSPALCNLYLLYWERAALRRQCNLITTAGVRAQVLREWLYFMRYIDDLRIINGMLLAGWVQAPVNQGDPNAYTWVYPGCLGLDTTGAFPAAAAAAAAAGPGADGAVVEMVYLDLGTYIMADGTYSYSIYAKDKKLPFQPMKYFRADSDRPKSIAHAVAVGQVYRIMYLTSYTQHRRDCFHQLMRDLHAGGFNTPRLASDIQSWLWSNQPFPLLTHAVVSHLAALCNNRSWLRS